jgi:K+-sensing histidine kinase KdpD
LHFYPLPCFSPGAAKGKFDPKMVFDLAGLGKYRVTILDKEIPFRAVLPLNYPDPMEELLFWTGKMAEEEINFTDFIASSIHDMKNSLNMQVSALEKIAVQCRDEGNTSAFDSLGLMIYQANRMNSNLIQLLSLYKLGKSIYPIDIIEHSISDVIEEALLQNQSIMDFRQISISVDCATDCYWYIDRDLVSGILINGLNNAYNYTSDKIRVAASVKEGFLELRIEDNGKGYPPHMLVDGALSENKGINFSNSSTGLGFYFSSRVAHMHKNGARQGSLTIENGGAYGGGCFVVRLP